MSEAIPPLPQYAFLAWCLIKAQGHLNLLIVIKVTYLLFMECDKECGELAIAIEMISVGERGRGTGAASVMMLGKSLHLIPAVEHMKLNQVEINVTVTKRRI
jgi:hypothetical protein